MAGWRPLESIIGVFHLRPGRVGEFDGGLRVHEDQPANVREEPLRSDARLSGIRRDVLDSLGVSGESVCPDRAAVNGERSGVVG